MLFNDRSNCDNMPAAGTLNMVRVFFSLLVINVENVWWLI